MIPLVKKFLDSEKNDSKLFLEEIKNNKIPKELENFKKKVKKLKILVTDLRPLVFKSRIMREYNIEDLTKTKKKKKEFRLEFPQAKFNLDEKEPTCSIRVRLPDGKTHDFDVNSTTKILEIFKYLEIITNLKSNEFELLYGFPLKNLSSLDSSIKEMNLQNCVLNMKIKESE